LMMDWFSMITGRIDTLTWTASIGTAMAGKP